MSATITIPHELERKIAGRAAAQGKDLEQFALEALERAAEAPSIREVLAEVYQEIDASGFTSEALDAKIEAAVELASKKRRAAQTAQALALVEDLYGSIRGIDRATLVQIAEDEDLCGY